MLIKLLMHHPQNRLRAFTQITMGWKTGQQSQLPAEDEMESKISKFLLQTHINRHKNNFLLQW